MFEKSLTLAEVDSDIANAITAEEARQEAHIELIASENYTSTAVMIAQGSQLTNKYAEGYPYKRYYGGCEHVDVVEQLAIDRAKALFDADYANVQPHSGSQANAAVFQALLVPGDTILGMSLAHGGHLTHGAAPSFSGKNFNAIQYGLNADTGEIDYDEVDRLAREHKPKMIIAGFSAYSRIVDWNRFRSIADEVGAYLFVDMAHVAGLIATGDYPSPIKIADVVFKTIPNNKGIYIEIKCGPEIVPTLINWIVNSNLRKEQISIIAFDNQVIKAFKSIAPHIKAHWLYDVKEPVSSHELLDSLRDIKADGLGSNNKNSQELVNSITKAGFEYHSWTIDDIQIAEQLLKWGRLQLQQTSQAI